MKIYKGYCTIPVYVEAENDDEAYDAIKEYFDNVQICYEDINDIDLYCEEEE